MTIFLLPVFVIAVVFLSRPAEKSTNQSSFSGSELKQKRLAMFFDGTWNSVENNTNVWRMRALCSSKSSDGEPQLIYYSIGVNGFWGGAFGQGIDENIRLAYEWLIENYRDGDEIYIFGFSRGAFTARSLAGLIAISGVLQAGSPIGIAEVFERYKDRSEKSIWKLREQQSAGDTASITDHEKWLIKYSQPANIKMVGVWDTVGSIGLAAGNIPRVSSSTFDYLQTGLRTPIQNGYHALAIDEHRAKFAPTLWDIRFPKNPDEPQPRPRSISSVEQRWFVGAHADVGGGYKLNMLAQAPLRWLMEKAEDLGLTFRSEAELDGDVLKNKPTDSYSGFLYGAYSIFSSPYYRVIGADPDVREDGSHINVNETIDASVFTRWRADPNYRPENLIEWAKRKKVNPAEINSSVRGDNPSMIVSDQ